jgi:DNA-binding GntR family transcriptional regulator
MSMMEDTHASSGYCKAYRLLKMALIEHRFRPGEQLLIADLADHLGVSSTPVREALTCLRAEALLDTSSRRGFFVKILNEKEMTELYDLSYLDIKSAIERGLNSVEPDFQEELHCEWCEAAHNWNEERDHQESARFYAEALEKTCEQLVSRCGNALMMTLLRNIHDRTHYIRTIDLEQPERRNEVTKITRVAASGLENNDAGSTLLSLGRNLNATIARLPELVKEGMGRACTQTRTGRLWSDWEIRRRTHAMRASPLT